MVPQPDAEIRMASSPRRSISALQTLTFCRAWTSAVLAASGSPARESHAWKSVIDLMSAFRSKYEAARSQSSELYPAAFYDVITRFPSSSPPVLEDDERGACWEQRV